MADTFVKMVEFRSTGLEQIDLGLKKAVASSESAITSGKKYQSVIDSTLRALPSMARVMEQGVRIQKEQARTLGEVARAQDRVNAASAKGTSGLRYAGGARGASSAESGMVGRTITAGVDKFQRAITTTVRSFGDIVRGFRGQEPPVRATPSQRFAMGVGGAAAGLAPVAGAAAAGGLALGVSGLSGTVPMARLNQQMERFTYELGNTLTPFVDTLTKKLGRANQWLAQQPESTQNHIGATLAIGGGAVAANLASRSLFGVGIGGALKGGYNRLAGLGGYQAATAGVPATPAELNYRSAYGSRGLPAGEPGIPGTPGSPGGRLGGAARGGGAAMMALGAVELGYSVYQSTQGTLPRQRYERGELTANEANPLAAEYEKKWAGKSDEMKKELASGEIGYLRNSQKVDKERYQREKIEFGNRTGRKSAFARATDMSFEAEYDADRKQRLIFLENQRKGKTGAFSDHQANAMVGGDFGEIGSGYYAAASEFGKSGYTGKEGKGDAGSGNGLAEQLQKIYEVIQEAAARQAQQPLK